MQRTNAKQWTELQGRPERLVGQSTNGRDKREQDEVKRLIHEIQVHQAELEMQNHELSKSRDTVEAARRKYELSPKQAATNRDTRSPSRISVNRCGYLPGLHLIKTASK